METQSLDQKKQFLIEAGEVISFDSDWNEEKPTPTASILLVILAIWFFP